MKKDILYNIKNKMEKCIFFFKDKINNTNTHNISYKLIKNLNIKYNNKNFILHEIASISIENNTIIIHLFNKSDTNILKNIKKSLLNINNIFNIEINKTSIKIFLSNINKIKKEQIIKLIQNEFEKTKISIRNIRRDVNDNIKKILKNKEISNDDSKQITNEIEKISKDYISLSNKIFEQKKIEILNK